MCFGVGGELEADAMIQVLLVHVTQLFVVTKVSGSGIAMSPPSRTS